MFEEHDIVVLTADVSGDESELKAGDVGTIIHIHPGNEAFVVEFTTVGGETLDIATVLRHQMRPITGSKVTHARVAKVAS